jgi:hypothetical protein
VNPPATLEPAVEEKLFVLITQSVARWTNYAHSG